MKTLKKVGLGLISAVALASAAPASFAADIYRDEGGGYKDVTPVDYAPSITWTGFYVGANIGAAWDDSDDIDIMDDAALIGGGHLGYNWQGPSNFVVGLEGDISFADDVDYFASIRGRLGYAFGPTLAYVTGGAAFIELDDGFDDTGWVAGLGVDHKIRDNISFGVEGLYYAFDDDIGDVDFWAARARLTYHFGGGRY